MNTRFAALVVALGLASFVAGVWFIDLEHRPVAQPPALGAAVRRPAEEDDVPSPNIAVAEPAAASTQESANVDWTRRYHASTDDFALARELAVAGATGDGRAQYELGRLLLRCETFKRIMAGYTEGSLEERVEFHLANSRFDQQAGVEFRRGALRCGRLFTEDPFAGMELPDEANAFEYWAQSAIDSGDPVAVVQRMFRAAVGQRAAREDENATAFRRQLLDDVRGVAFSGDGAALYVLGGMLSHPSVVTDVEDGYAWMVVACSSGYDCSNSNPDVGSGCVERGTCESAQTFLDVLQRDLGAGKYAAIYARAQDIRYKIDTGDWDGLQQYLELK